MSIDTLPTLDRETREESLADLVSWLGDIPLERIRLHPAPGTATEEDVVQAKCCELLDGVLVEKAMGWEESTWAALLIQPDTSKAGSAMSTRPRPRVRLRPIRSVSSVQRCFAEPERSTRRVNM